MGASTAVEVINEKAAIQTALTANFAVGQRIVAIPKGPNTVNLIFYKTT